MKKIDKIYEKEFNSLDELNGWIAKQEFDVMVINVAVGS